MRLSWNEVRARAAAFAEDWREAAYEKGETQSFYNAFFDVFGVWRRNVARYEQHVAKLDNRSGFIDLFWPGVLLVEQTSAGRDLRKAYEQAGEYFDALPERERPRFILVSDFQTFELHDLDERETVTFPLADGARRCPPEDVGGPPGFMEFLEAVLDPGHEEHAPMTEWYGGPFDPEDIDETYIRGVLKMYAARRRGGSRRR